ncbi:MAG: hypothetical protein KDC45_15760, partial [Bacteroidetes bacterium]|nr:hypothetical protein [Bacteroidota bacterium]
MRTIATSILSALIVTALSGRLNAQSGDTFGYSWTSSDQGGIAFNWTDIKSIGTRIIGLDGRDDANDGPFPIGFSFPYYGAMYDSFRVCSNGFITFYNQSSAFSNYGLPDAGEQEMIAPFWNDLNLGNSSASHVYYYYDGTRLIVQFYVIPPYSGTGNYTFQVILYPDGRFVYQYLDMNGSDKTATIGWQNTDGSDGFTISLDDPVFVHNNLAIQVKYGPKAPSNLIAVGGDQIATLTWDQNIDTLLTVS